MAEVTDFLNNLSQKGETNGVRNDGNLRPYFNKKKIKDIHATCCTDSEIEVYDFDECKEVVVEISQLATPKSCDALKIDAANGKIYFIEFKRWTEFIERQLPPNTNHEDLIKEQIKRFQLDVKLHDSLLVLNNMVYSASLNFTGKERKLYRSIPKDLILLVDINLESNPLESLAVTLNALSLTSSSPHLMIKKYLEAELRSIPSADLSNIQNILLKNCETIEDFL